eukprot:g3946.t1
MVQSQQRQPDYNESLTQQQLQRSDVGLQPPITPRPRHPVPLRNLRPSLLSEATPEVRRNLRRSNAELIRSHSHNGKLLHVIEDETNAVADLMHYVPSVSREEDLEEDLNKLMSTSVTPTVHDSDTPTLAKNSLSDRIFNFATKLFANEESRQRLDFFHKHLEIFSQKGTGIDNANDSTIDEGRTLLVSIHFFFHSLRLAGFEISQPEEDKLLVGLSKSPHLSMLNYGPFIDAISATVDMMAVLSNNGTGGQNASFLPHPSSSSRGLSEQDFAKTAPITTATPGSGVAAGTSSTVGKKTKRQHRSNRNNFPKTSHKYSSASASRKSSYIRVFRLARDTPLQILKEESILKVLHDHQKALRRCFNKYSTQHVERNKRVFCMSVEQLVRFCKTFHLTPTLLTRPVVIDIFKEQIDMKMKYLKEGGLGIGDASLPEFSRMSPKPTHITFSEFLALLIRFSFYVYLDDAHGHQMSEGEKVIMLLFRMDRSGKIFNKMPQHHAEKVLDKRQRVQNDMIGETKKEEIYSSINTQAHVNDTGSSTGSSTGSYSTPASSTQQQVRSRKDQAIWELLHDVFEHYCSFGDRNNVGVSCMLTNHKYAKFVRESQILDSMLDMSHADLVFRKILLRTSESKSSSYGSKLAFRDFFSTLVELARLKYIYEKMPASKNVENKVTDDILAFMELVRNNLLPLAKALRLPSAMNEDFHFNVSDEEIFNTLLGQKIIEDHSSHTHKRLTRSTLFSMTNQKVESKRKHFSMR